MSATDEPTADPATTEAARRLRYQVGDPAHHTAWVIEWLARLGGERS